MAEREAVPEPKLGEVWLPTKKGSNSRQVRGTGLGVTYVVNGMWKSCGYEIWTAWAVRTGARPTPPDAAGAAAVSEHQQIGRLHFNPNERIGPMAHVYEDKPDARQADTAIAVSRFRPRYRALTDDEKALHDAIKGKAAELEALFETVKAGRYRSLGMTALEEAVMWTVKELTS